MEDARKDRGYAWTILAAASAVQIITHTVVTGGIGAVYVEILNYYPDASTTDASWIGTIQMCTMAIVGCLLGPLIRKLGCRPIILVGAAVSCSGLVCSMFVRSLTVLYFTFGFCSGLGCITNQMAAIVSVQHYFEKRRSIALGVLFSGLAVGGLLGPSVTVLLVDTFALPGSFAILAAIQLQCLWLGSLLRPLPPLKGALQQQAEQQDEKDVYVELAKINENIRNSGADKYNWRKKFKLSMKGKQSTVRGKSIKLPRPPSQPRMDEGCVNKPYVCRLLDSVFGLAPFKKPSYGVLMLATYLGNTGHAVPVILIPLRAVSLGHSETEGALLLTVAGIASLLSRLGAGFLGNRIGDRRKYAHVIAVMVTGLITTISYVFKDYGSLMFLAVAYGLLSGVYMVFQMSIVVDMWGTRVVEVYSGHFFITLGLGVVTMNPISGMIIDVTGSIPLPFLVFGLVQIFSGLIILTSIHLNIREKQSIPI